MSIPDEPVRGSLPPSWWWSLPGLERVRALSFGHVPNTPIARLLGVRLTHVDVGSVTCTMPAAAALAMPVGVIQLCPLASVALRAAAMTAVKAGQDLVAVSTSEHNFRPAFERPGRLLARARVVNTSSATVFVEAAVEDSEGRRLCFAVATYARRTIEPAPPPPPARVGPIDEPAYATPDPYLRPGSAAVPDAVWAERHGRDVVREILSREPVGIWSLYGFSCDQTDDGLSVSMPASPWFCGDQSSVSEGVLMGAMEVAGTMEVLARQPPEITVVGVETAIELHRPVPADSRPVRCVTRLRSHEGAERVRVRITDADGQLVASGRGTCLLIPRKARARRESAARRVLATLLFTDIVSSTEHAQRLGDEGWRQILDQHRSATRREIERAGGIEVDTAGDGFFVRFDSPARAIEAARRINRGAQALGIELRLGIHTGECELDGREVTGVAVHTAARIQGRADAGEIWCSSVVRDLATGSEVHFDDRGEHRLKGVRDPMRLFTIVE